MQDVETPVGEHDRPTFRDEPVAHDAHLSGAQYLGLLNGHRFAPIRYDNCKDRSSASIWLKSGTTISAPARINRERFASFMPNRRTSSLATPTQTPPRFRVSR